MFRAEFADGRTEYFVLDSGVAVKDNKEVLRAALQRQQTGELPTGNIVAITRVR